MLQMIIARVVNALLLSESSRDLRLLFWRFTFAAENHRSLETAWKRLLDDLWHRIFLSDGLPLSFEACDGLILLWSFDFEVPAEHIIIVHQLIFVVYDAIICQSLLLSNRLTKSFLERYLLGIQLLVHDPSLFEF